MVSHGVGLGLDGLGHGAVRVSGGVFAVPGLGHGASRAIGHGSICGRAAPMGLPGPLGLMVGRRHEAWQGAKVTNSGLLHLDFGEMRKDCGQVVVVPAGPFQLASHRAFLDAAT